MTRTIFKSFVFICLFSACSPEREEGTILDNLPASPTFSVEPVPGDGNRFVVKDLSTDNYTRLWDFDKGANPLSSKLVSDTVFYTKAGQYTIGLHISKADGSGTAYASKKVTVLENAAAVCNDTYDLLTGACGPQGKCWTLAKKVAAVKVGPTYDDFSWFTSLENGLQNAQYDDGFCFTFENFVYQNKNNGASVDPWDGYKVKPYDPGISSFILSEDSGINSRDQIILANDQFMGLWDSDNVADIVKLTEGELVVRMRLRAKDGTPAAEGWFELSFVKK